MSSPYSYIWEYTIDPTREAEFLTAYGPDGDWVELFREHAGYIKTELHRDRANPNRFITIDYWESRESWEAFRTAAGAAFEALDKRCEEYTTEEHEIGTFVFLDEGGETE